MNRHRRMVGGAVAVLIGAATFAPAAAGASSSARLGGGHAESVRASGPRGGLPAGRVYLALGDSLSAGFQTAPDYDAGYVGTVYDALKPRVVNKIANLSCPGETTATMIDGGTASAGYTCPAGGTAQLVAAETYLTKPGVNAKVITLSIGANDLGPCLTAQGADEACVTNQLRVIGANLVTILGRLRAAEPQATIVVLNYYDPYLATWLDGSADAQDQARASVQLITQLNGVVAQAATRYHATVADVAGEFRTDAWSPSVTLPGVSEPVPLNVAMICQNTLMCDPALQNVHPNDAGYALIAKAVLATLGGVMPATKVA